MVKTIKSPVNMEIMDGQRTKVVHVNRLQHRVQRLCKEIPDIPATDTQIWEPPWAEHITKANVTAPSLSITRAATTQQIRVLQLNAPI